MYGYILPTGNGRRVIWYEAPRFAWGELEGLGNETVLLSPSCDINTVSVNKIPSYLHDNIYRQTARRSLSPRWVAGWTSRMMLWGAIFILSMDQPLEDIIGGVYLLLGMPFFAQLSMQTVRSHLYDVLARFKDVSYAPEVTLIYSPRLMKLEGLIECSGIRNALQHLDELGLGHLREFYRRCAWQERWPQTIGPPTGAGILQDETLRGEAQAR